MDTNWANFARRHGGELLLDLGGKACIRWLQRTINSDRQSMQECKELAQAMQKVRQKINETRNKANTKTLIVNQQPPTSLHATPTSPSACPQQRCPRTLCPA